MMRTAAVRLGGIAAMVAAAIILAPTGANAADQDSGLVVSPSTGLFDVLLIPGQPESRLLTVTNTTDTPLDVHLSAELAASSTPDHHFDDIVVHTDIADSCDGVTFDPSRQVALSELTNAQQTVLAPHRSQNICVTAMVPWELGSNKAMTVVHLTLSAIQEPDDLATTGVTPPYLLLLIAVLLAISGWFLAVRRRHLDDTPRTERGMNGTHA